jgi:hypothetical protein
MDLSAGVSLGQLLLAFGVILVSGGAAFGTQREQIKTLQNELKALAGMGERLAKIETNVGHIKGGLDELKADLKGSWFMQEPANYTTLNPRRRKTSDT